MVDNPCFDSARVVELVDTPVLGAGAFGIRVQVPSLAILGAVKCCIRSIVEYLMKAPLREGFFSVFPVG